MALIPVHKPPKAAWNPNRPLSSLLLWQVEHLHEAEKRLPRQHHTDIYVNAIKTEEEAANYIRAVTEAIHNAHAEAEARRTRRWTPEPGHGIEIAAVADEEAERRLEGRTEKKKKRTPKPKDKK
jgi:hypothetical protein